MASFKVTPQMLKTASTNIANVNTKFQENMKGIITEMRNLKQKWESDASNNFLTKVEKLSSSFEAYYSVINSYSKFLDEASTAYKKSDEEISKATNMFS